MKKDEFVELEFHEIVRQTKKAIMIRFFDHVTWLPLAHVKLKKYTVMVPIWLHPNLVWEINRDDIDYVASPEEEEAIRDMIHSELNGG
jgi:hypothetical protein